LAARRAAEAVQLEPNNITALELLGSTHYLLGERAQARQAWERALRVDPSNKNVAEYLEKVK
jgi:cytochrome c-type biogenesis protein CcmH/NrfG